MVRREEALDRAREIVTKDRNKDYGDPENNFRDIAEAWNIYLGGTHKLKPIDVANMMVLMKIMRAKTSPFKLDHYDDIIGYAACATDCIPGELNGPEGTETETLCTHCYSVWKGTGYRPQCLSSEYCSKLPAEQTVEASVLQELQQDAVST